MRTLSIQAHQKGLELLCQIMPGVPERVITDVDRLRQVLMNLVGNSVKFTDNGEIELSVSLDSQIDSEVILHFAVRDTGVGIPKDKLSGIFEAFVQADSSTTRRYGGTGLGLSICTRLVSLLGGRI